MILDGQLFNFIEFVAKGLSLVDVVRVMSSTVRSFQEKYEEKLSWCA